MAFARDVYTATGGQTDFTISFSYLEQDDIVVTQNGTTLTQTTHYTFPNSTTIRLVTGATADDTIVLQRASDQSARNVIWTAGSLTSNDLNDADKQLFFMAQEAIDVAGIALGLDTDEQWTAASKRIKNVTDPTAAQDAATKNYVDLTALGSFPTPLAVGSGGTGGATVLAAQQSLSLEPDVDVQSHVMTTQGDMVRGGASGAPERVAIGSDGQMLTSDGTDAVWEDNMRPNRNAIINGDFRIWQRGTSFSTGDEYTADRWYAAEGTGATIGITRQAFTLGQADVPGEPLYYLQFDRTVTGSAASQLIQPIESVRTFAGREVTLSFYARGEAADTLNFLLRQDFGSGGSPSADVDLTTQNAVLTTSWQKFTYTATLGSISGKTLGSGGDDSLQVVFEWPTAAGAEYFEIAHVQLELGPRATPFEWRSMAAEQGLCERFYEKSYPIAIAPGTIEATGVVQWIGQANATDQFDMPAFFKTRKRNTATVTAYNASTGASSTVRMFLSNRNSAGDLAFSLITESDCGFTLVSNNASSKAGAAFHWTAAAEITP
jgi:hypothetical protein